MLGYSAVSHFPKQEAIRICISVANTSSANTIGFFRRPILLGTLNGPTEYGVPELIDIRSEIDGWK
jgi:hypothetical protein